MGKKKPISPRPHDDNQPTTILRQTGIQIPPGYYERKKEGKKDLEEPSKHPSQGSEEQLNQITSYYAHVRTMQLARLEGEDGSNHDRERDFSRPLKKAGLFHGVPYKIPRGHFLNWC